MGRLEGAFAVPCPAETGEPFAVFVVAVNVERAVPIDEQEPAVFKEGEVRRHEAVAAPDLGGFGVFLGRVLARFHRREFLPDRLAFQSQLGERLFHLVGADVQELFAAFFADLDAVAAALELLSERADELAGLVEDEDRGMVDEVFPAFMDDVEQAGTVDGDVVGDLPTVFGRELREVVLDFVLIRPFAHDQRLVGLGGGMDGRGAQEDTARDCGGCGGGGGQRGLHKLTTGNLR